MTCKELNSKTSCLWVQCFYPLCYLWSCNRQILYVCRKRVKGYNDQIRTFTSSDPPVKSRNCSLGGGTVDNAQGVQAWSPKLDAWHSMCQSDALVCIHSLSLPPPNNKEILFWLSISEATNLPLHFPSYYIVSSTTLCIWCIQHCNI